MNPRNRLKPSSASRKGTALLSGINPVNVSTDQVSNGDERSAIELTELRQLVMAQAARIDAIALKLGVLPAANGDQGPAAQPGSEAATKPQASNGQQANRSNARRIEKAEYRRLILRIRKRLRAELPRGATIAVVSKGDDELLRLTGQRGCHFPQTQAGVYAGYYPGTSAEALLYLEGARAKGAGYLAFPATALWWLDHYVEFAEFLSRHHTKVIDEPETCVVYRLEETNSAEARLVAPKADAAPDRGTMLFDADWYLTQNPDVRAAGIDPAKHHFTVGAMQGRNPHPLFDAKHYWKTNPEAVLAGQSPLEHYLTVGWKKGNRPNPNFSPAFYRASYPDVDAAGIEPLTHFAHAGLKEGRTGNPEEVAYQPYKADFTISREPDAYQIPMDESIRAIAFHLPQFHPIRENDKWWGKGFTEWTNVRRATPQFRGHYQPHVPSTLGYYDLRAPDVLEKQAELARANGVHGFCFYYYWFAGKVLLDRPLRRMMATGKPDVPFCICWANENWTRRWDGMEHEVLMAQRHSPEDDLAFLRKVEPLLLHKNYIRVGDRPLLIFYRPALLPDARATADRWREFFRSRGHGDIYLAMARTFRDRTPAVEYGFDAAIQFPPHVGVFPVNHHVRGKARSFRGRILDYGQAKQAFLDELAAEDPAEVLFPGVMPSWDNTARRQESAEVWLNSSPESYSDWLSKAAAHLRRIRPSDERLVFINAWNEWGEGCHLEPDRKFGHAFLNATKLALRPEAEPIEPSPAASAKAISEGRVKRPLEVAFVSHDAHPHGAQHCLLTLASWMKEAGLVNPRFILTSGGTLLDEFSRIGPVLRLDVAAAGPKREGRVLQLLRSFCGPDLAAVYVNSAAACDVCRWTRRLNVPHVAHVHELEASIRRWVGQDKMKLLRNSVDLVIAASDPVAHNLRTRHRIEADRIRTIEESIRCTAIPKISDAARRRCKGWLGLDPRAKIVLGCGTTDWRKGPDLFVEVAARVRRAYKCPVQFVWVGSHTAHTERRKLDRLVAAQGLADTVRFVGAVATPLPYMAAADLFLLPSREDPFPLVCLEAADCGLPVVCFGEAGGMPDFVAPDCGAVVPYLNVPRMARAVVNFLEDDGAARRAGDRARHKVRSQFDVAVKGPEIYAALAAICRDNS